ncbi:MAG: ABC transporter ATP-binding protein [Proteobacteria bacterium]|nr:ABC transporter ATP-binding protein [Pseudomonadota bacterium]
MENHRDGSETLLKAKNLKTYFHLRQGILKAVDDVSFELSAGEIAGIVGESGCGKSVLAHSIMRLLKSPPALCSGELLFKGTDLMKLGQNKMRRIRGGKISMIFQDSLVSLNPVVKIGAQLSETLLLHRGISRKEAKRQSIELLEMMSIPNPEKRYGQYICQLSGGMRQRVMIAMGLSCRPDILLADEPTTALDVTTQAQILDLMKEMNRKFGTAVLFITHDLGVVAGYTQRVMVFYAGKIVESAVTKTIFRRPEHPYTVGLMNAIPRVGKDKKAVLANIRGTPPSLIDPEDGCSFYPRCDYAQDRCRNTTPVLKEAEPGHLVRCHFPLQSG